MLLSEEIGGLLVCFFFFKQFHKSLPPLIYSKMKPEFCSLDSIIICVSKILRNAWVTTMLIYIIGDIVKSVSFCKFILLSKPTTISAIQRDLPNFPLFQL